MKDLVLLVAGWACSAGKLNRKFRVARHLFKKKRGMRIPCAPANHYHHTWFFGGMGCVKMELPLSQTFKKKYEAILGLVGF